MKYFSNKFKIIIAALFIGAIQFILMSTAINGNLFSSYAYMTDDGLDWIVEGLAFNQLMSGADNTQWRWLRTPIYVLVNSIDDLLGGKGSFVIITHTLAVVITAFTVSIYAHKKGFSALICALVAFGWYFSYFGEIHLYILSDTLASGLMTVSAFLSIYFLNKLSNQSDKKISVKLVVQIWPLIVISILAGLTQTYGLIPVLVISFTYGVHGFLVKKDVAILCACFGFIFLISTIFLSLSFLWSSLIPHGNSPDQFALLSISFRMWDYYDLIWPLAFCGFIPVTYVVIFNIMLKKKIILCAEKISLLVTCSVFGFLSLIYQWRDPRFTFIYLPLAWMTVLAWCEIGNEEKTSTLLDQSTIGMVKSCVTIACVFSIMTGQLLAPKNRWHPALKLSQIPINPSKAWVVRGINKKPVDRLNLLEKCENSETVCDSAFFEKQWSPYSQSMHAEYLRRSRLKDKAKGKP